MKTTFLILTLITIGRLVMAQSTNAASPVTIGAIDATNFYDRTVTITGRVAQVSIRPSMVFLNFDHPWPDSPFTGVIFAAATNRFGDLKALKGQSVALTGKIVNYHNRPEIILESTNQLKTVTTKP